MKNCLSRETIQKEIYVLKELARRGAVCGHGAPVGIWNFFVAGTVVYVPWQGMHLKGILKSLKKLLDVALLHREHQDVPFEHCFAHLSCAMVFGINAHLFQHHSRVWSHRFAFQCPYSRALGPETEPSIFCEGVKHCFGHRAATYVCRTDKEDLFRVVCCSFALAQLSPTHLSNSPFRRYPRPFFGASLPPSGVLIIGTRRSIADERLSSDA